MDGAAAMNSVALSLSQAQPLNPVYVRWVHRHVIDDEETISHEPGN